MEHRGKIWKVAFKDFAEYLSFKDDPGFSKEEIKKVSHPLNPEVFPKVDVYTYNRMRLKSVQRLFKNFDANVEANHINNYNTNINPFSHGHASLHKKLCSLEERNKQLQSQNQELIKKLNLVTGKLTESKGLFGKVESLLSIHDKKEEPDTENDESNVDRNIFTLQEKSDLTNELTIEVALTTYEKGENSRNQKCEKHELKNAHFPANQTIKDLELSFRNEVAKASISKKEPNKAKKSFYETFFSTFQKKL